MEKSSYPKITGWVFAVIFAVIVLFAQIDAFDVNASDVGYQLLILIISPVFWGYLGYVLGKWIGSKYSAKN